MSKSLSNFRKISTNFSPRFLAKIWKTIDFCLGTIWISKYMSLWKIKWGWGNYSDWHEGKKPFQSHFFARHFLCSLKGWFEGWISLFFPKFLKDEDIILLLLQSEREGYNLRMQSSKRHLILNCCKETLNFLQEKEKQ